MTNFGASFRKARESKGISLDQIATETRISTRFLSAIESEEFHLLPGGIFNRGFVRTFAEIVGLDPDQAVVEYERLANAQEPSDALSPGIARPSKVGRHLYSAAIGLLVLVIVIFYLATRESGQIAQTTGPPPAPAPAVIPPPPPPSAPETTSVAGTPDVSEPKPALPSNPQTLTLDVEARQRTWIKITADGTAINIGEILEPGMTRKFTAQASIMISVGNAAGLVLKINDMQLKPLGKSGDVRSVTITPANLKDFTG